MSAYNANIQTMKKAIDITQTCYNEENADNYILRCKNAVVIWYQPQTLIACVRFCEDKNQNEYHLYNRCCAYLEAGDNVKVYYTTNAAKGWIAVRCGKPNFLNEYGQNIFDIRNCCEDEDKNDCCETVCCEQGAVQCSNTETVTTEEWTERIEGSEDEVRDYEESLTDSPFKKNGGE